MKDSKFTKDELFMLREIMNEFVKENEHDPRYKILFDKIEALILEFYPF